MKSTTQVVAMTGMSKNRCLQFARTHGLPKFGQMYMWSDEHIALFRSRIGKRGNQGVKRVLN